MEQFKLIYIFATVLQYGSMNAAAPHLGMADSAISKAIRKLENHYSVKLLNRTTRSLTPMTEGWQLQQYARQLIDWHDAVEREMQLGTNNTAARINPTIVACLPCVNKLRHVLKC